MIVTLEHINLSYGKTKIFNDLTLSIPENSFNLLIGPSGIGKSTLLKIIAGLFPQLKGTVLVDNTAISQLPANQRAQHVGFLFQDPDTQFAMPTPFEELTFTLENLQIPADEIAKRATAALEFVGIKQLADQQIDTLSGGEKQKVALAIIVAMKSKLLLLDEPFANVDIIARQEILKKIKTLQADGVTILVADHDFSGYQDIVNNVWEIQHQTISALDHDQFMQRISKPQHHIFKTTNEGIFELTHFKLSAEKRTLITVPHLLIGAPGITLLTGANGSGKSTLFNALTKLKSFDGQITYQSKNIQKLKVAQYVQKVALLFQSPERQFLRMTVDEELALSFQHSQHQSFWSSEVIDHYLTRLNLNHLRQHIVYQLSGGQKKKLQLLLMLIVGTPVLLLDEPIAGLDVASVRVVAEILQEISAQGNQRFIIISHQLDALLPVINYHLHLDHQTLYYQEQL